MIFDKFRKKERELRLDFPVNVKTSVQTKPFRELMYDGMRCYGLCWWKGDGTAVIQIERNLDVEIMIDSLWHEWAHIRVGQPKRIHHTRKFWLEYGKIRNFYVDGSVA